MKMKHLPRVHTPTLAVDYPPQFSVLLLPPSPDSDFPPSIPFSAATSRGRTGNVADGVALAQNPTVMEQRTVLGVGLEKRSALTRDTREALSG